MSEVIFNEEERFQEGEYKVITVPELKEEQLDNREEWNNYWKVIATECRLSQTNVKLPNTLEGFRKYTYPIN